METYTSWRGVDIGPAETFDLVIPKGSDVGWAASADLRQRVGLPSLYGGSTPDLLMRAFQIRPGSAAGSDYDTWRSSAAALFSPYSGMQTLEADFDGDTRTTQAYVTAVQYHPELSLRGDRRSVVLGTLARTSPYWRSAASQSTTSLTVTNDGNAPANPTITIKPTTGTVVRKRVTFTENTGEGLVNHPLQLSVTTSGASATTGADYYVFNGGKPALFQIVTPDGSSKIYIRKSLAPSGSDFVDVVYGSAVNNTITANQLPPWGMDWAHASFSNTTWVYRSTATTLNGIEAPAVFDILKAPKIPGVWTQGRYAAVHASDAWTLTSVSVQVAGSAALVLNTQIRAITSDALLGFDVNFLSTSPLGAAAYRIRNATTWTTVGLTGSGSGASGHIDPIDVPAALDIALIAADPIVAATWDAHPTETPIRVLLESADVPTISVGSSVTMARINGRLKNTTTGDYVELRDIYIDADASGGLVIDTLADGVEKLHVYPSLSTSPMYTGSGGLGWAFSNPAGLPLAPGANVLAWEAVGGGGSGDGSPTITTVFSDTWV